MSNPFLFCWVEVIKVLEHLACKYVMEMDVSLGLMFKRKQQYVFEQMRPSINSIAIVPLNAMY